MATIRAPVVALAGLVLALIAGCQPPGTTPRASPSRASITEVDVSIEAGAGPVAAVWPEPDHLLVTIRSSALDRLRVGWLDLSSLNWSGVELATPGDCRSIDIFASFSIVGRVAVDRRCYAFDGNDFHDVFDVSNASSPRQLVRVPWFPDSVIQPGNGGGWIAGFDSGVCAWIDVIPGTGAPSIGWPIVVEAPTETFAVNTAHRDACDTGPLASGITESVDGAIAFVAAATPSAFGHDRLAAPQTLYLMAEGASPLGIAGGLGNPTGATWGPDGDRIAVIATIDGIRGVWIFTPNADRTLVYEGTPVSVAWSPSGQELAVVDVHDGTAEDTHFLSIIKLLSDA